MTSLPRAVPASRCRIALGISPSGYARSIAGGLFVADRWVYFAFVLNWYTAEPDDPATVKQFFSAINTALTLVKNSFS